MSRRAVIVGGARTPFVRAFGDFVKIDTIGLGVAAVRGLLDRTRVPWGELDAVVWGGVILPPTAPNVGREIALDLGLPASVEAMTATRACASGLQAITLAAAAIERGDADVVIAGGSDSTSNAPVTMPQSLVHKAAPVALSGKSGPRDYLRLLGQLSIRKDLLPSKPEIAERSTGQLMGEACEDMAERNHISRASQDALALTSHQRAAAAVAAGRYDDEVVPVTNPDGKTVFTDQLIRGDTTLEKLGKLRPAFRKGGTLTAGNSSALTDGAAAVLLMSEEKAAELGMEPLAAFRSWSYVGVDPADQLLIGPALAMPGALERAGLQLSDIDVVDMHEAFASQVLCVRNAMASDAFCQERLGRNAVGTIDDDKLNVHGGSVAIGHPFGATGARMVLTMANELATTDAKTALLGICAAGGLGAGAVMEAV